ncbi:MAG: [FeFe] hydrogenase H-cluster radical SAM maturase HydE [Alistipes sp.]|nr:[FeFe] hydrogenase H-cluster radical SAM maturase HydE [Alistipes sp.]
MERLVDRLAREQTLPAEELRHLLNDLDSETQAYLHRAACKVARAHFGREIYIRGLIEIGNICRNDCRYCGIRRSNRCVERYRLSPETILSCCEEGYRLGLRTFVLQGGEDPAFDDRTLTALLGEIRRRWPECAVTLSLGERPETSYRALFEAGARRYLLRHETIDTAHYRLLHPEEMSLEHRLECLRALKRIGFQTGTGIMVGSPEQTVDHIVKDLLFMREFRPQMIGIGPFIPQHDTPFGTEPAGSAERTLVLISILRLMHPAALIPSTTALATLSEEGRTRGILAGANVVMPNLSPPAERAKYALYEGKAASGAEAAEGVELLRRQLEGIGYRISPSRGDYGERP